MQHIALGLGAAPFVADARLLAFWRAQNALQGADLL